MSTYKDAEAVVTAADQATPADQLAWAAGVMTVHHSMYLRMYRFTRKAGDLCPNMGGGTIPGGLMSHDAKGVSFDRYSLDLTLHVSWSAVARLVDHVIDRPDILGPIEESIARRAAALRADWYRAPFGTAASTQWFAVERACSSAAEALWVACKPAEQLDLFTF